MNKIILKGNLTNDPDFTKAKKDKPAHATFSIAVNRSYGDKVDFFFCHAWRSTAEFIDEHFEKGSPILIVGSVETYRKDDDSPTQYSVNVDSVEFAGFKKEK